MCGGEVKEVEASVGSWNYYMSEQILSKHMPSGEGGPKISTWTAKNPKAQIRGKAKSMCHHSTMPGSWRRLWRHSLASVIGLELQV